MYMQTSSIHQAIAQDIGSGTLGQLAGVFHYYKENKKEVYTILSIHPCITPTQRQVAIEQRKEEIQQTINDIDIEFLHITVNDKQYSPTDFDHHKQILKKTLQ